MDSGNSIVVAVVLTCLVVIVGYLILNAAIKTACPKVTGKKRIAAVLALMVFALIGQDKPPPIIRQLWRMMFWSADSVWQLQNQADKITVAEQDAEAAEILMAEIPEEIEQPSYISFDWHAPNRMPWHERQNILGWTCQVVATNINGTLYEDHYVAFTGIAAEEPAVINIEYAAKLDDGTVVRETSATVTNNYPDTVTVSLQSGDYECYWFRCIVPERFANNGYVRDWNGEALFGSPIGSGKGFDLAGTLVIDDEGEVWLGKSGTFEIFGQTYTYTNGVNVTQVQTGDENGTEGM